jgi:Mn-dependent DtxR family transcriptional regulator
MPRTANANPFGAYLQAERETVTPENELPLGRILLELDDRGSLEAAELFQDNSTRQALETLHELGMVSLDSEDSYVRLTPEGERAAHLQRG